MGAPTETYIDPSIAADSGTGTSGDPYGDVQYALNQVTRDSTNGDRFNIKQGTDEILGSTLSFAIFGSTFTDTAPLIFRGYSSTAGDTGIGGITGNAGNFSIVSLGTTDFIYFVNLHLHNTGSATVITVDDDCRFINCEINNSTGGGISCDNRVVAANNHIHDIAGLGITFTYGTVIYNTFENGGTNKFTIACDHESTTPAFIAFNVFDLDSTSDGIKGSSHAVILNNSLYGGGSGTGEAIGNHGSSSSMAIVMNNVIQGFNGAGGDAIELGASAQISLYGYNSSRTNANEFTLTGDVLEDLSANDDTGLGSDIFTNAGSDDFSVNDVGNVKAGAFVTSFGGFSQTNYLDRGAVQRIEGAGGGGIITHPGMTGGIRG